MLKSIHIQNYAIIEKMEITFPGGLTTITGETGAGKSILLGALGLIMGKRADTKVLYNQDVKCFVEAVFDITAYGIESFFEEEGLDYLSELIIRREIAPGGKSRAFVNDTPVTLDILLKLTEGLIDIHQQFDILEIQKPVVQLQMIDALAGNAQTLDEYKSLYRAYRHELKKLEDLLEKNKSAHQEIEFLTFQINEFNQASLVPGEQAELESLLQRLSSSEDIKRYSTMVYHGLEENENAAIGQLQTLANQFSSIKELDPAYDALYSRLLSVKEELSDISREALHISDNTEYDEESIHATNERLNIIYRLEKKHGVSSLENLLLIQNDIQKRLDGFSDMTSEISAMENSSAKKEVELRMMASKLRKNRMTIIPDFENKVHDLLTNLSMEHAYIKVKVVELSELTATGLDDVSIQFAPNKGSDYLPLKDTASGGEMSRLTLCVKSLVAGAATLPTLIFDEIDAGVSGDVAQKMGSILLDLSKKHQVISITHSPQIAAKSESHFWVYKTDTEARTITSMKLLSSDERITEIAKMLSGNPPTDAARANARDLIGL